MSQTIAMPDLGGNSDLFRALYKVVCVRAQETRLPIEVILCQVIYQATYEMLLWDELPCELIAGVVEAAAAQLAIDFEAEDAEGGDR
ncbi:hypothetical protein AB1H94_15655 [Pseudomonas fulva]|uniref:hypothetical protein n=1 Tax=Pseudomonas fulva TaxID=47880 RepID=UPI00345D22F0